MGGPLQRDDMFVSNSFSSTIILNHCAYHKDYPDRFVSFVVSLGM